MIRMAPFFGPAGNSDSFKAAGHKNLEEVPAYLQAMGLTAYEYQAGRGVHISPEKAAGFGALARQIPIALSIHAPYYISLSSTDAQKRENSIGYILASARAAKAMGASRVIVHSGSCGKISRGEALELACDTLRRALTAMDAQGLGEVHLCPETMGKVNQLGTVEEVLALCALDERLIPCIDFGHVNARTFGGLRQKADFAAVLDAIGRALGQERMRRFHTHFSHIQYTEPGGEKCHLTFADTEWGPDFEPLAELIAERDLAPTIICESAGTQAEDAAAMKRMTEEAKAKTRP